MALKSSSPINLAALRQDYSMLPRIAAVKAESNKQFFNAISSGLEKRKEKIEKKQLNEAAKKMIEPLLVRPEFQKRFGTNANADEVLKLIGDPRKAVQLANDVINSEMEFEDRERKIKRDLQILARGQQEIDEKDRLIKSNEAFSNAILGLSENEKYELTSDQANLMSPDQLQKFIDIKAKQTPDDIESISLGDGAFAITANGEYKGMYTVPKDPNNALTAELSNVQGRLKYFKQAEDLIEAGDIGGAVQMLNALNIKVGGEPLSTEDPETVRSIVGLEVKNLQTGAGKTGGETAEVKVTAIDGIPVSDQEKPEAEPAPEPAAEEAPVAPVEQQREVSTDEKGSIYDESGMPKSFVLRGLSKIIPSIVKGGSPAAQKIEQETLEKIQSMASNVPPERIRQLIVALERRKRRFALSPEEEAKVNQELQALNLILGEGTAFASK